MADHDTVRRIFFEICDLEGDVRDKALAAACGGNIHLRDEVASLLSWDDGQADSLPGIESVHTMNAESRDFHIGDFHIIRRLGGGGMAEVFEAIDGSSGQRVALKVLRSVTTSRELLKRFRNEQRILSNLNHPAIARMVSAGIHRDAGPGHGIPYFAMELIEGVTLGEFVRSRGAACETRLKLIVEVCDGVQHAHDAGIVHRDLKPGNILVEASGRPRIVDFGIALLSERNAEYTSLHTQAGQIIGTVPYMSPEQVAGQSVDVDHRTDIYSLGVILYELLTERLPFDIANRSLPEAARIIRDDFPPSVGSIDARFRGDIDTILRRAMEKDPARRYKAASEFGDDIQRFLDAKPIEARPPGALFQLTNFARRNKPIAGTILAIILMLAIGLAGAVTLGVRESSLRRTAELSNAAAENAAYQATITAARLAMSHGEPNVARGLLLNAPEAKRGWEWNHLVARTDTVIARVPLTDTPNGNHRIAWDETGAPLVLHASNEGYVLEDIMQPGRRQAIAIPAAATDIVLSENGQRIAWSEPAKSDHARLVVLDAPSGKTVFSDEFELRDRSVRAFALGPDGRLLAVSTPDALVSINLASGERASAPADANRIIVTRRSIVTQSSKRALQVFDRSGVRIGGVRSNGRADFATNAEGDTIVLASIDGRIIHTIDGESFERLSTATDGGLAVLCISPDGRYLVASVENGVRIRDLRDNLWVASYALDHSPAVAQFSPDASRLLVQSRHEIVLLDLDSTAESIISIGGYVYAARWSESGALLATGALAADTRLWDSITGEEVARLDARRGSPAIAFSPDGLSLIDVRGLLLNQTDLLSGAVQRDRFETRIERWETAPSRVAGGARFTHYHSGEGTAVSPDRTFLLRRTGKGLQKIERATGRVELTIPSGDGDETFGQAVTISPDQKQFAVATKNGSIKVFTSDGSPVRTLAANDVERYSLAFTQDGSRLVASTRDGRAEIWDIEAGVALMSLKGHELYVYSVAFSPQDERLATASGDGTVRIWDSRPARRRHLDAIEWTDTKARVAEEIRQLVLQHGDLNAAAAALDIDAFSPLERDAAIIELARLRQAVN